MVMSMSAQNTAPTPDITTLLQQYWSNAEARNHLHDLVYQDLRRRAEYCLRSAGTSTLPPSALVNEAFIKIFQGKNVAWNDRNHFFAFMFRAMKQVLIDLQRKRNAKKRRGTIPHFQLREDDRWDDGGLSTAILAADLLETISKENPLTGRILGLLYCDQLSFEEISHLLREHEGIALTAKEIKARLDLFKARVSLAMRENR